MITIEQDLRGNPRQPRAITRGTAKSGDLDIAYAVEGNGPETVLLVMGLGGRGADWGEQFPQALARRYRVVWFDNRGTGASSIAPGGFSLEDMARDAVAVMDAVNAASAHVVGISMGGMIAQLLALDHPGRVDRVVLVATHFGGANVVRPTPEATQLFDPQEFIRRNRSAAEMMRHSLSVIAAPGFVRRDPEAVEALARCAGEQPTPSRSFMAQLQAAILSDRSERVRDIRKPTLVVHGDHDTLIPPQNGSMLAERIPGARLEVLDDCGHMPMWERPAELARSVMQFLVDA